MRIRAWVAAAILGLGLAWGGPAAADDPIHLELRNGSKFDGRIARSDDTSITFRPSLGGELRIAWKDLDTSSWLAAKKAVTDPKDARGLLALAKFAADNALRLEAEALLDRSLKADPALRAEADSLAPRLAELRHADAVVLFDRATAFLEKSNWYQALGRFQEARKLEPDFAGAINGIGEAYYQLRRLKEARQFIDEAIRVDPKCKDALINRAMLALLELDFRGCLAGLDDVLALPAAPGRFGTREAVFEEGRKAGLAKPEEAWKKFADQPMIQAADLRPVMAEIVKGPEYSLNGS